MTELLASIAQTEAWLLRVAYPVTLAALVRAGMARDVPLFCVWLLFATIHGAASGMGVETAPYGDTAVGIILVLAVGEAFWKFICWRKYDLTMIAVAVVFIALAVALTGHDAYWHIYQPRIVLRSIVFGLSVPILAYIARRPKVPAWRRRHAVGFVILAWAIYLPIVEPARGWLNWWFWTAFLCGGLLVAMMNWWWALWIEIRELRDQGAVQESGRTHDRGKGSQVQSLVPGLSRAR